MSEVIRRRKIIETTSIAAIVGEYLPLREDGSRLQSLCPFHNDDLDTFRLDPVARSFVCSACGATGDIVDFVRMSKVLPTSKRSTCWTPGPSRKIARALIPGRAALCVVD